MRTIAKKSNIPPAAAPALAKADLMQDRGLSPFGAKAGGARQAPPMEPAAPKKRGRPQGTPRSRAY